MLTTSAAARPAVLIETLSPVPPAWPRIGDRVTVGDGPEIYEVESLVYDPRGVGFGWHARLLHRGLCMDMATPLDMRRWVKL